MAPERVRYVKGGTVPKSVGPGRVLMHNHVMHGPRWPTGMNGFRAWTAKKLYVGFVLCPCGYAGLKHYAWREHVKCWRDPKKRSAMERWVRAEERRWGMVFAE